MVSEAIQTINGWLGSVLFFDITFGLIDGVQVPFLVAWLAFAALYFTVYMGFPNLRFFKHGFEVMLGKWRTKEDKGLITALSISRYRTLGNSRAWQHCRCSRCGDDRGCGCNLLDDCCGAT